MGQTASSEDWRLGKAFSLLYLAAIDNAGGTQMGCVEAQTFQLPWLFQQTGRVIVR